MGGNGKGEGYQIFCLGDEHENLDGMRIGTLRIQLSPFETQGKGRNCRAINLSHHKLKLRRLRNYTFAKKRTD